MKILSRLINVWIKMSPVTVEVMSILRRAYSSQTVIRTVLRNKTKRAETAKRIQKENKALFGALLETKKQKLAREKREIKKGRIKNLESSIDGIKSERDTEHLWMLKTREKELTRIRFKRDSFPCQTKTILKTGESFGDDSSPNRIDDSSIESGSNSHSFEVEPSDENTEINTNLKRENEKKEPNLPLDILVKNMTTFSYIDDSKPATELDGLPETQSISAYDDKSKLSIPSVTRILNKTMSEASKLNLELWKQRMIVELGVQGFEIYSRELLLNGKQFHSSVQNYLVNKPFDVPQAIENSWRSVQHVLKDVSDVRAIESHVVHPKLLYRGIVDCVASYKGNLCVIDWKKSDKPKATVESTFDAPIQVASYIGAINFDINYSFQVRNGLVVVAYTNGDPATVHEVNPPLLNKYWKLWLRRLQQYYLGLKKSEKDLSDVNNGH